MVSLCDASRYGSYGKYDVLKYGDDKIIQNNKNKLKSALS